MCGPLQFCVCIFAFAAVVAAGQGPAVCFLMHKQQQRSKRQHSQQQLLLLLLPSAVQLVT
jgi:hypothetical protein